MPSRSFTSGRKFSTTISASATSRRNTAMPRGSFRLSVIPRLLRCKFWKSEPCRGPPSGSTPSGISILTTSAPQSASWRTAVGPARTRVKSRTRMPDSGREFCSSVMSLIFLLTLCGPFRSCSRRAETRQIIGENCDDDGEDQEHDAENRNRTQIAALVEIIDDNRQHLRLRGEQHDRSGKLAHHADEDEAPRRDDAGAQ